MDQSGNEKRPPLRVLIAGLGLALIIALGAVAIVTDNAGADYSSVLDDGNRYLEEAAISPERAVEVALSDSTGHVDEIDLKLSGGELYYEVVIDDSEVFVDATSGDILVIEHDNDDDFSARNKLPELDH